jgi:hypothetical protein
MAFVEMITKHYEILGERTAVQLTFYDNGDGCKVVARHWTLNLTVSIQIGENMDREIPAHFENMISTNMAINNIQNYHQYVQYHHNMRNNNYKNNTKIHNKTIAVENPDDDGEDSIMIGVVVN